jgi:4-amino-4-deoxychorismate lyase
MKNYIESISVIDGNVQNIGFHQERVNEVFYYNFSEKSAWKLNEILPHNFEKGWLRMRFIYDEKKYKFEIFPYSKKLINKIKLVEIEDYEYPFKFEDRRFLVELLEHNPEADEVIMVKNNLLTDSTIGNIALEKNGNWYTPSQPLLNGTKRRKLLKENRLIEREIKKEEIQEFDKIAIINAFLDLEESNMLSVSKVIL